jgi:hypothetical protein
MLDSRMTYSHLSCDGFGDAKNGHAMSGTDVDNLTHNLVKITSEQPSEGLHAIGHIGPVPELLSICVDHQRLTQEAGSNKTRNNFIQGLGGTPNIEEADDNRRTPIKGPVRANELLSP